MADSKTKTDHQWSAMSLDCLDRTWQWYPSKWVAYVVGKYEIQIDKNIEQRVQWILFNMIGCWTLLKTANLCIV